MDEASPRQGGGASSFVKQRPSDSAFNFIKRRDAMATFKVGYLIGSLAKEPIDRKLAQALINLARRR